jgi:hypothetical protein
MTLPHGYLRVGSVSLGSARKAARAVKAANPEVPAGRASPAQLERYLGHFGPSARKTSVKKSVASVLSGKSTGAKKASAKKTGRAAIGKKASVKKSSGASKKR